MPTIRSESLQTQIKLFVFLDFVPLYNDSNLIKFYAYEC